MEEALVERAVEAIQQAAHTGRIGDGKIFVTSIDEAVRIRPPASAARMPSSSRGCGLGVLEALR